MRKIIGFWSVLVLLCNIFLTTSCALENGFSGSASRMCNYLGEYEGKYYFNGDLMYWNQEGLFTQGGSSDSAIWTFSADLKTGEHLKESAVSDELYENMKTWEQNFQSGKPVEYTVDHGVVSAEGKTLLTVPGWADGSGDNFTRIGLRKFPGVGDEVVYALNYETLPKGACPPHDFSTYVLILARGNKVRVVQTKENDLMPRVHLVIPWGDQAYLVHGDRMGLGDSTPIVVRKDGTYVDLKKTFAEKMGMPADDWHGVQVIGVRNSKVLFLKQELLADGTWGNFQDVELYEMNPALKITKAKEDFHQVRKINGYPSVAFTASGHILVLGDDNQRVWDLTAGTQGSIAGNGKGVYHSLGNYPIILAKTGKEVSLPIYEFQGIPCLCIENFNGLNYKMKWINAARETTFTFTNTWKPQTIKALPDGNVVGSDVIISVDGVDVPSYNTGGWSLVPIQALKDSHVVSQNVDLEKLCAAFRNK